MKTHIRSLFTLVCAASASLLIISSPAQAGFVMTLQQVGPDVVATGSGVLDLTGLSVVTNTSQPPQMYPGSATILAGSAGPLTIYSEISGPTSFGSGSTVIANSGTGDLVGIGGGSRYLFVPQGYISGTALSDSATWNSATFSSLSITAGTYEWTWGGGANQNFTLNATVPEPSVGPLLAIGALLLFGGARLPFVRSA